MRLTDKEIEAMMEYWLNIVNMGKFHVADMIERELRDCGIKFRLVYEGVRWQRIEERVDEDYAHECVQNYYASRAD
jgi:cysteinyl-tRNA synthetase